MISGYAFIRFGNESALLLRPYYYFVDCLVKIYVGNRLFVVSRGENSRFVHKVGNIRARKARSHTGENFEVDARSKGFVARVYFKNLLSASYVGHVDVDLTVESARTKKSGVENIRAVGRRHDDNALVGFETVHLYE